jgi:hypothetical protein
MSRYKLVEKTNPAIRAGLFIELVLSDWLGNVRHFIKHKGFNTTFSRSHVVSDVLAR